MGGKFNPFQSKRAEVVRIHSARNRKAAEKRFEKIRSKRPCLWAEIEGCEDAEAERILNALDGETSVALWVKAMSENPESVLSMASTDALITRLWKNFNKLYLIHQVETDLDSAKVDWE